MTVCLTSPRADKIIYYNNVLGRYDTLLLITSHNLKQRLA